MEQSVFPGEETLSAARGTEWQANSAGTDSGATATKAAASNVVHKVQWVQFFTDTDSLLQILDDTTVIWEAKLDVSISGWNYPFVFPIGSPLVGSKGNKVEAKISSSTADCHVSFGGFSTKSE